MADISETTQYVREAPDIEAYKKNLMAAAAALKPPTLPAYQVSGMTRDQQEAIAAGREGIGAFAPYLESGYNALEAGRGTIGEAADVLRGADTRKQFDAAQEMYNKAAVPAGQLGTIAGNLQSGFNYIKGAGEGLGTAQDMAAQYAQGNVAPGQQLMGAGIGSLAGAAQGYDPQSASAFMNPYTENVMRLANEEINRQGDISRQNLQAQATKAGAFGGSREGVQRAELERGLAQTKNQAMANLLQQGYSQASGQAQQAFEQQQQRQMAQGQGIANVGQNLAAQNLQQAQLGQGAANLYGNLSSQQAALAGQMGQLGGQQANIYGQQSQLQQQLGQGLGSLAGQQFGVGQQMAQGLGSLATQGGNLGVQQAALGQTAQQLGQGDVNFLYNIGAQQQRQSQAELDALRATKMQETMQPYQQLAFQSDIYKGAPSTQMAITTQNQAAPSPFQQIAGAGTAALGIAGAANAAQKLF
jgi:hypothetical protein